MSLEPEKVLVRSVLESDRPVTIPDGLASRLHRIPDEVRPLRSLPVRMALELAPWAVVAAAGLVLAFGPAWIARYPTATGGPTPFAWSAEDPGGGFAEVGPFGISPVPLLAVLLVGPLAWAIARVRRGEDLRPILSMSSLRRAVTWKPRTVRGWIPVWGFYLVTFSVLTLTMTMDPIRYGSVYGPGPEVDEVTAGGHWYDEAAGDTVPRPAAPEYVFRVSPGDAFTVILSVRNVWPVPITVLGLVQSPGQATPETLQGNDAAWNGLGLLRDPAVVSALPQDVVPFHPVSLVPGQEVTLVLAYVAGECADPTAGLPLELPDYYNPGISLVYDVFGWRAVGRTYPPFDQAIPVREGCMRAGSWGIGGRTISSPLRQRAASRPPRRL